MIGSVVAKPQESATEEKQAKSSERRLSRGQAQSLSSRIKEANQEQLLNEGE
jgi:hypothetical protein